MITKKLNKTYTVFVDGNAKWVAAFYTEKAFMGAILKLTESFGVGSPFTGYRQNDSGYPWLFRQQEVGSPNPAKYHAIYLTSEEQITLLSLAYNQDD